MICVCGDDETEHDRTEDWAPCKVCDCALFEPVPEQLQLPGIDWDQYETKAKKWT